MTRGAGKRAGVAVAACAALAGAAAIAASCTSNPINVPVRTFERPQKVDVVCMQVYDALGNRIPAVPVVQSLCAPVPAGAIGENLPYHLYALVTQVSRGEVAVVDLTGGYVVDIDRSTPGINFIPVGAQPTDIATAPDARMAFVAAAEPNKPALYGVDSRQILGDSQGLSPDVMAAAGIKPPTLPALPACSLPQAPIAVTVIPRNVVTTPAGDAGAAEAGSDAGGDAGAPEPTGAGYELLVTLAGTGGQTAKIVSVDPAPMLRGAGVLPQDPATCAEPTCITPGSLKPCVIVPTALELTSRTVPSGGEAPTAWPDGIPYVDGGVDLRDAEPALPSSCAAPAPSDGGASDAGAPEAGVVDAGGATTPTPRLPRPSAVAFDDQSYVLYVADGALPLVHAIDVSKPGALRELPPLVATSADDPARQVTVGGLAISPPTRDLRRYLYAVDQKVGSIMVFDVTQPPSAPRPPMRRPHPELNPFQPSDRITFGSPVAAVAFVRHDWPITKVGNTPLPAGGKTGILCNPNETIDPTTLTPDSPDEALGALYGYSATNQPVVLGPYRLRGVFALATLTNGTVVTIDVDDWDAPCRRPDPMDRNGDTKINGESNGMIDLLSDLEVPEPLPGANDTNPYHAPQAFKQPPGSGASPATIESFFPVSAPNRMRANYLLRNDPNTGNHTPNLVGQPQLFSNQAALPTSGAEASTNPAIRPTFSVFADPSYMKDPTNANPLIRNWNLPPGVVKPFDYKFALPGAQAFPGVRLAFEVPDVHIDQDWSVTYEGVLPNFDGIAASLKSTDFQTMTMSVPQALFCRRGVEDWDVSKQRVAAELPEMDKFKIPRPANMDQWTGDYVQLADEILDPSDPYWGMTDDVCWGFDPELSTPQARHDACWNAYGTLSDPNQPQSVYRDFPILEAYDDHFVVGRFGYVDPNAPTPTTRQIVGSDPTNAASLKLAYCCFHHQATFHVRAGGQWLAVGSSIGMLHHITTDPTTNRCVQSCDDRTVLLNARAPELPQPKGDPGAAPDRNSPLAMRNPMFAFLMWAGAPPTSKPGGPPPPRTNTLRDYVWKFSTRGQMAPLTVPLASGSPQVDPQSMLFIESLGQLAVVDGASQGLVLIDLNIVAPAHAPYF